MESAEIKKALECCAVALMYGEEKSLYKLALDLINRYEARIETLQMDKEQLQSDIINANQNLDHITELWEREKEKVAFAKQKLIKACRDLQAAKAEIERLKKCVNVLKHEACKRERNYDPSEEIDNLLKELVGDTDV